MVKLYLYIGGVNLLAYLSQFVGVIFLANRGGILQKLGRSMLSSIVIYLVLYLVLNHFFMVIGIEDFFYYCVFPSYGLFFLKNFKHLRSSGTTPQGQVKTQIKNPNYEQNENDSIVFHTKEDTLTINRLNTHFLALAGTRGGKTKSIGLPILRQYRSNGVEKTKSVNFQISEKPEITNIEIDNRFHSANDNTPMPFPRPNCMQSGPNRERSFKILVRWKKAPNTSIVSINLRINGRNIVGLFNPALFQNSSEATYIYSECYKGNGSVLVEATITDSRGEISETFERTL